MSFNFLKAGIWGIISLAKLLLALVFCLSSGRGGVVWYVDEQDLQRPSGCDKACYLICF